MAVEQAVLDRIKELIDESRPLIPGDEAGQATSDEQAQKCAGWLASAQHVVSLIFDDPDAPYRAGVNKAAEGDHGFLINAAVGKAAAILEGILSDAKAGLLVSVADQARAETFDNFLDHAEAYFADKRKNEAGVIVGVVFEDTVRRISRKEGVEERGVKLDALISELAKRGIVSGLGAKRARVAADLRTKATHAQWDEFQLDDVKATIDYTRGLLEKHLDG